jgi:hypothetical protein
MTMMYPFRGYGMVAKDGWGRKEEVRHVEGQPNSLLWLWARRVINLDMLGSFN